MYIIIYLFIIIILLFFIKKIQLILEIHESQIIGPSPPA